MEPQTSKRRCESPAARSSRSGGDTEKVAPEGSTKQPMQMRLLATLLCFTVAPVLSERALEAMSQHTYKAGAYTPLDNFLSPHLQKLTDCLPRWLAPNLITFGGAVPMTLFTVYLGLRCPTFEENAPPWLLCSFSLFLMFYLVCDAIDGKQARRTGSSSPLGQVFDHGIDCLMTIQIHWLIFAVAGVNANWALPLQAGGQLLIFLGHWEEHFTHVFRASVGPVGVTEVTIFMSLIALAGGLTDPKYLTSLQRYPLGFGDFEVRHAIAVSWIFFVFSIMLCYISVTVEAARKENNLQYAWSSLMPVVLLGVGSFGWRSEAVTEPRLLAIVIGLLFFLCTTQMIALSMAKHHYPVVQPTVPAFLGLVVLSWFQGPETFSTTLRVASSLTTIFVMAWASLGVLQLANFLDVGVFRILPKKASKVQ